MRRDAVCQDAVWMGDAALEAVAHLVRLELSDERRAELRGELRVLLELIAVLDELPEASPAG